MNDNLGNINEINRNNIKETKSSKKINNSNNIKKEDLIPYTCLTEYLIPLKLESSTQIAGTT